MGIYNTNIDLSEISLYDVEKIRKKHGRFMVFYRGAIFNDDKVGKYNAFAVDEWRFVAFLIKKFGNLIGFYDKLYDIEYKMNAYS